jgi:Cd2+/Zn2+-exporting ATPase
MAQIKAIALYKTRTITYGTQSFPMFFLNGTSYQKLLACTAGTFSEHPLAQAIVKAVETDEPKQKVLKHHGRCVHMFGL